MTIGEAFVFFLSLSLSLLLRVLLRDHECCLQVIADLNNDTRMELIVSVSYFFDRQQYDDTFNREELRKR